MDVEPSVLVVCAFVLVVAPVPLVVVLLDVESSAMALTSLLEYTS